MKDYADRAYVHGRIHALMDGFPGRARYAEMYNAPNANAALVTITGPGDETDISRIKEHLFREHIYPLLELIDASPYYRPFLVSALRLAEGNNLLLLAGRLGGMPVRDEWLDISPYQVLPGDLNKKDVTIDEMLPALQGTYLDGVFTGSGDNPVQGTPDRFISAFLGQCARSAHTLMPCDRGVINLHLALIMTIVRMSGQYRHHEYYSTGQVAPEEDFITSNESISDIPVGVVESRMNTSLKRSGTSDAFYRDPPYLKFLFTESMHIYRREWDSTSTVTAYLVQLYMLIRNLFVIAEGFRFGLSGQEMAGMIVCEE